MTRPSAETPECLIRAEGMKKLGGFTLLFFFLGTGRHASQALEERLEGVVRLAGGVQD